MDEFFLSWKNTRVKPRTVLEKLKGAPNDLLIPVLKKVLQRSSRIRQSIRGVPPLRMAAQSGQQLVLSVKGLKVRAQKISK